MQRIYFSVFTVLALALTGGQGLQAQNGEKDEFHRHEVSFQANQILQEVLSLSQIGTNNPYLLRYAFRINEKHALTAGFGGGFSNRERLEGDGPGNLEGEGLNLRLRLGYQYRLDLGYNMELGLGWDLYAARFFQKNRSFQLNSFPADSLVMGSKLISDEYGTGPRISFNYRVTDRFLIGTEVSFYYTFFAKQSELSSRRFYNLTPDGYELSNYTTNANETSSQSFSTSVPSSIYIIFRF